MTLENTILTPAEQTKALDKYKLVLDTLTDTAKADILEKARVDKFERIKRNRRNRARGKANEKAFAKATGSDRVPYSGSSKEFGKGDIVSNKLLGECKDITPHSVVQKNIVLPRKDLDDIIRDAGECSPPKIPWMGFHIKGDTNRFVVMQMSDWVTMCKMAGLLDGK